MNRAIAQKTWSSDELPVPPRPQGFEPVSAILPDVLAFILAQAVTEEERPAPPMDHGRALRVAA